MPKRGRITTSGKVAVKRHDLTPDLAQELAEQAQASLPPAGFQRREELAKRRETLEELAAQEDPQAYRVDPKAVEIDNEIADPISKGLLDVTKKDEAYDYCWVNFVSQHGYAVTFKQSYGWEVVSGDMPEAKERKDELGRRRIGDTILMRIKKDVHLRQQLKERERRGVMRKAVGAELLELAHKHRDSGVSVTIDAAEMDASQLQRLQREAAAKQIAGQQFDRMVRTGQVPGLNVHRR